MKNEEAPNLVSPDAPPTADPKRWERGLDPWHRDAFPDEFKDQAPVQATPRKSGWFELDWCGNQIGFFRDGTQYEKTI